MSADPSGHAVLQYETLDPNVVEDEHEEMDEAGRRDGP